MTISVISGTHQNSKVYPFESQLRIFSTFDQNFDFKIRKDHQKISYERHVYESVDVIGA